MKTYVKSIKARRIEAHEVRLTELRAQLSLGAAIGSDNIKHNLEAIRGVAVGVEWEEFQDDAREARASAITHLKAILRVAEKAEAALARGEPK